MYHLQYDQKCEDKNNWCNEDLPLTGFSWKGGSERETSGIWLWSELFLHDFPDGQKVAIAVMDTQGSFDTRSTVKESATIFALSTMVSSVLVFNVSQNIQEDDLQHLQLFTEYGRLALADCQGKSKPFQHLWFLVRDWSFPYEAAYGEKGGDTILRNRLEIHKNQHLELQSLRRHIVACFESVKCFLMPHPGLNVATNPSFDGRMSDMTAEFKTNLKVLAPRLLAPENLVVKNIDGQVVRTVDLIQYFVSYVNIYSSNELPEPKSMLLATAEANNLTALAIAKDTYMKMMEGICGGQNPYLNLNQLFTEHVRHKDKAIEQFQAKRKMGGEVFSRKFREQLEFEIDEAFTKFKAQNESKNIFKAARTPAVFLVIVFVTYVLSGIFGLFGLFAVANFCNLVMGIVLINLFLWAYIRASGELRDLGVVLDNVASFIWGRFLKPIYRGCLSRSISRLANPQTVEELLINSVAFANSNGKVNKKS